MIVSSEVAAFRVEEVIAKLRHTLRLCDEITPPDAQNRWSGVTLKVGELRVLLAALEAVPPQDAELRNRALLILRRPDGLERVLGEPEVIEAARHWDGRTELNIRLAPDAPPFVVWR